MIMIPNIIHGDSTNEIVSLVESYRQRAQIKDAAKKVALQSDCSGWTTAQKMATYDYAFDDEIASLETPQTENGWTLETISKFRQDVEILQIQQECQQSGFISKEYAIQLNNAGPFGLDVLFGLIRHNVRIDLSTIEEISNPTDPDVPGWTIAHDLAARRQSTQAFASAWQSYHTPDGWTPLDILLGHLPNKPNVTLINIQKKLRAGRTISSGEWAFLGTTPEGLELLRWISIWHQSDLQYKEIIQAGNPFFSTGIHNSYTFAELAFDNLFRFEISPRQVIRLGNPGKLAILAANNGVQFSLREILRLNNPRDHHGRTIGHLMAQSGNFLSLTDLMLLENPADNEGATIAHEMASQGYEFTIEHILKLGNPPDKNGVTIAHICAADGAMHFTVDEIIAIGNPADSNGETVAHASAKAGWGFTPEEIRRLNDPRDWHGGSIHLAMARSINPPSVKDLAELGNAPDNFGWTPAHMIAFSFRKYNNQPLSVSELVYLGNPPDLEGITPAHLQASAGYFFNTDDLIILRNPADLDGNTVAHYIVQTDTKWFAGDVHGRNWFTEDELTCIGNPMNKAGKTVSDYQKRNVRIGRYFILYNIDPGSNARSIYRVCDALFNKTLTNR